MRTWTVVLLIVGALLAATARPAAQTRTELCDSSVTNCRTPLLDLIKAETVQIDVGMWFMEDSRFSAELIKRHQAGVRVRVLMDPRAEAQHDEQAAIVAALAAAGIPMRRRTASGIEHWKAMLFEFQSTVYFGSANFSADAFVPVQPYVNYVDETILFTNKPSVVNSFRTKFDDAWMDTVSYADYANVSEPRVRSYDTFPIDPELNFPPQQDFSNRSVSRYNAETQKIDVMMYRITDQRHTNAMINAFNRGVPIRMIVDPQQYRDVSRLWNAWNVDRLFVAGIPLRFTVHQGINHGKLTLLYGQAMSIFGSSNWTSASASSQHEHNYFTTDSDIFSWFVNHFERKWFNLAPGGAQETGPFVPLPADKPVNKIPADLAVDQPSTDVKLKWYGGPWAHVYDVYFGTTPTPPLFAANLALGPSESTTQTQTFALPPLEPGRTYYWQIVSKTMANLTRVGPVWSFTTAGAPPPPPPGASTIVLWAANVPAGDVHGDFVRIADAGAAGSAALHNPDRGRAKIAPAMAAPANYFEVAFDALGGVPYRLWIRMRAQTNATSNDSVHVQFSDSADSLGTPLMRIGTASSAEVVLQDGPSGATPRNWGWGDNGWGMPGQPIYFSATGTHVIRVQQREDGPVVDQIVLSPDTYITSPPGPRRDDATILPSTGGSSPPPPPPPPPAGNTIVLWASQIAAPGVHGNWQTLTDVTAAGGAALRNPNAGAAKIAPAMANPVSWFESTFNAEAGVSYHVWVRMRADADSLANDSVHLQFSDATTESGTPYARIGTTSSAEFVLQAGPTGAAPHGWGWTDNGWGSAGPHIRFEASGVHTVRIQQREDGAIVDQIVISPDGYLNAPPGGRQDDTTILPSSGPPPPPPPPPSSEDTVVLWPGASPAQTHGTWQVIGDATAAGGSSVWNPNSGAAKVAPALASPGNYFEMTFVAQSARPYHVWVRMRAEANSTANDSVHVQFDNAIDALGAAVARIGTPSSAEFVLQAGPSGAAPRGWGWTENGWEAFGPHVYFASDGVQTIRVQQREDGPVIDQIVISPDAYLTNSPGVRRDDTTILPERTGG
jgi:cardiolipin hydrolase